MSNAYQKSLKTLFTELGSSAEGLSTAAAGERLKTWGENVLPSKKPPAKISILVGQFSSPLIYILVIAAAITAFLRDYTDTVVISLAILVNTVIGYLQEARAQYALTSLKKVFTPRAYVYRDGERTKIEARFLVPGDVIWVKAGQRIPADARLISKTEVRVDEAILTGEAHPVTKRMATLRKVLSVGDRRNLLFAGTEVVAGTATALVVATGAETEVGQIGRLLQETVEPATPLQQRVSRLSRLLALVTLGISLAIFILGWVLGQDLLEIFVTAVALAVAAIPEGLVVSLTVILAVGMQRIFKKRALVNRLVAAETLGSVTTICVDKTGTLTRGRMEVADWRLTDEMAAVSCMVLCNDLANPTEQALWDKVGSSQIVDAQKIVDQAERAAAIPFTSQRKYMVTAYTSGPQTEIFAKGAPEKILAWSKLSVGEREKWEEAIRDWSKKGLRLIALASKEVRGEIKGRHQLEGKLGSGFTFLGLVGLTDPIRPGVKGALRRCQQAGIRVAIITGDYESTARAVMEELDYPVSDDEVIDGEELSRIDPEELGQRVKKIKLYARVSPADKLKIVAALQERGEVVAMTGDGVNDAPALKKADIGIVVGGATEVARETADMVLLDSDFGAIVAAIEEGRGMFANIRKIILYLLSDSFSEIFIIVGALVLGLPLPITASQILWVNLANDGLPGLALTVDPRPSGLMHQPPRSRSEPLVNREIGLLIFLISLVTAVTSLGLFRHFLARTGDLVLSRTVVFAALGVDSLLYVFSCRVLEKPLWRSRLTANPYLLGAVGIGFLIQLAALYFRPLAAFLGAKALPGAYWLYILGVSALVIVLIEVVKYLFGRRSPR